MKRLILSFVVLPLTALTIWGQITISPSSFVLSGVPSNNDVNIHIDVTNTSQFDVSILWAREVASAPGEWLTWICDKNLCYLPTANACSPTKPNVLAPGEKMDFQIHVNPGNVEGSTPYEIIFTDYGDPNIELGRVQGEVVIDNSVSTKNNPTQSNLTIFPNPTTDAFQVSEATGVKYIEVFNIVGNKVRSFDAVPNKQYTVGDLPDGMYLVRLMTSTGKIIKTIRLSKR